MPFPSFPVPRPSFDKPPVVEVVLGVQFLPLDKFELGHFGLFWQRLREEFPTTEAKPALDPITELPEQAGPKVGLEVIEGFPKARVWFANDPKTELVQVQSDRFIFNWRQGESQQPYPRYGRVRQCFDRYFGRFVEFVSQEGLGEVVPTQSEVSYINQVLVDETASDWTMLHDLLEHWSRADPDPFLGLPEQARAVWVYRLPSAEGFLGRLHVSVEPRIRLSDRRRLIQFSLTARGQPVPSDREGVLSFFDYGRECVVRGLARQAEWRRDADAKPLEESI